MRRVLLCGATGFVGQAVYPALVAAGWQVRCLGRHVDDARRRWPDRDWVAGDVASAGPALDGCSAALYLVHGMGEGAGYHEREVESARSFAAAAATAGLERIVYLGGVVPSGERSEHLQSRADVGKALRAGAVPTIELRASMIIGHGSLSWLIVRDLAARLPVMVLPRWMKSRTQPIAIADVVAALVGALALTSPTSEAFDIPGPEILSGREILEATAAVLGHARPRMLEVPFLSPKLSSLWVRFVTRADWKVAREIVVGLSTDLLAHDDRFWSLPGIGKNDRVPFAEAARRAIDDEKDEGAPSGLWGKIERALRPAT